MKDSMTEVWAYVVAALIYGIILVTVLMYLGEIVLWIQEVVNG